MIPDSRVRLRGQLTPPGDKSIGHRLAFLAALARGRSRLEGFPPGQDCASTLGILEALGVTCQRGDDVLEIEGQGMHGWHAAQEALDAGNSGSTARMACGLLAGQSFDSHLVGDGSLSARPFARVVEPLTDMNARFETRDGYLPVTVFGGRALKAIDYTLPVPSAQVKTAVLFAGLYASGTTRVRQTTPTRDHTEIALGAFGAPPRIDGLSVAVNGGVSLEAGRFSIPGDFSSAAFFIAAAAFLPGSELTIDGVGLNPTRTALLSVLETMGAQIEIEPHPVANGHEPMGRIRVSGGQLHGTDVPEELVASLIDEIPVLAVAAAHARGTTRVTGASELRVKESDRLSAIIEGLTAMGADVEPLDDGFAIHGGTKLHAASLRSHGDHRMVMAWAIASLAVDGRCDIDDLEPVKISFPGFWRTLDALVR